MLSTAAEAAGKRTDRIAARLVMEVVEPLVKGAARLTLALDDTPTPHDWPHVEGAGVHHNPTDARRAGRSRWQTDLPRSAAICYHAL